MKKFKKLSMIALSLAAVLTIGAASASATTVENPEKSVSSLLPDGYKTIVDETGIEYVVPITPANSIAVSTDCSISVEEAKSLPEIFKTIYDDSGVVYIVPNQSNFSTDNMTLIEETETVEGGLRIINRFYEKEIITQSTTEYEYKHYAAERFICGDGKEYGTLYLTMSVSGTFKYNQETSYVINASRKYTETTAGKGCFVGENTFAQYSNCGGAWFGNKYAWVDYNITVKLEDGSQKDFDLWIEVNSKGTVRKGT